jgi:GH35 family endo-1,4-beta-xylanase
VTFWGITDKYSWLNRFKEAGCTTQLPTPLLWDESYSKKLSYRAVVDAFAGR